MSTITTDFRPAPTAQVDATIMSYEVFVKGPQSPTNPDGFVTKDSGKRQEFETGSRRDTEEGKLDYTLIPWKSLRRYIELLQRGADKYSRHNWRKGQKLSRAERSMARHLAQYLAGEKDEDHLAAVVFNAVLIMDHEDRIASGELPASLDDREPI